MATLHVCNKWKSGNREYLYDYGKNTLTEIMGNDKKNVHKIKDMQFCPFCGFKLKK